MPLCKTCVSCPRPCPDPSADAPGHSPWDLGLSVAEPPHEHAAAPRPPSTTADGRTPPPPPPDCPLHLRSHIYPPGPVISIPLHGLLSLPHSARPLARAHTHFRFFPRLHPLSRFSHPPLFRHLVRFWFLAVFLSNFFALYLHIHQPYITFVNTITLVPFFSCCPTHLMCIF